MYDVLIIGAGAAGLNAAMVLGRQRRSVLLVDTDRPRNAPAGEMHMFLTRDGADPRVVREIGGRELLEYPSVEHEQREVVAVTGEVGEFTATLAGDKTVRARRLLLATGLVDAFPPIPGLAERFGRTVFHCPFCHGWEARDQPLAILGNGLVPAMQATYVADRFASDAVLLSNGPLEVEQEVRAQLDRQQIRVDERPIARLTGEEDLTVEFTDGDTLERFGMFAFPATSSGSSIGEALGATVLPDGCLEVDAFGRTTTAGVSAAGDAGRHPDLPGPASTVIGAAGSGASAAMWLEQDLFRSGLESPSPVG